MEKTVLVTGGAQGIGEATARLLAGRGYRVAVADIRKSEFFFVKTDVSREPSVRACIRAVVKRFGRLDALVNNAGLTGASSGPIEKLSLNDWNRRLGVNLTGAFLMAKHAVPHLRQQRRPGRPDARTGQQPRPRRARQLREPRLDQPPAGPQEEGPRAASGRARRAK